MQSNAKASVVTLLKLFQVKKEILNKGVKIAMILHCYNLTSSRHDILYPAFF